MNSFNSMELNPADEGVRNALIKTLGHSAPFNDSELESIQELRIEYARDIAFLSSCRNLRKIEIFASEIEELLSLSSLTKIRCLKIVATPLRDIYSLSSLEQLEEIHLLFTFVEEIEPILSLPKLEKGYLFGNPWSEESFQKIESYFFENQNSENDLPLLYFSSRPEWKFTRRLNLEGHKTCFAYLDVRPTLVRPGIPKMPNSACDFVEFPMAYLNFRLTDQNFSMDSFFETYGEKRATQEPYRFFVEGSNYEIGRSKAAQKWVQESQLSREEKEYLLEFIDKFRRLIFYKESDTTLKTKEERKNISLPNWYKQIKKTISFVLPGYVTEIQMQGFELSQEFFEFRKSGWYSLGLIGTSLGLTNMVKDGDKSLFPIGEHSDSYSILAINIADSNDKYVYEFNPEDLLADEELEEGTSISVFSSYASLLSHIIAIKVEGEDILYALE